MGILSNVRLWVSLAVVSTVLGIVYLGYTHYQNLLSENATLKTNVSQLETAVEEQKLATDDALSAIEEWKLAQEGFSQALTELRQTQQQASAEIGRLNGLFAEHDLGKLAARKPGLIERRANAATDRAFRMLQCASGDRGSCPDKDRPPD